MTDPAAGGAGDVRALTQAVLMLAAELWRTKDRLRSLEAVLEAQGVASAATVDRWRPTAADDAAWGEERDRFVAGVFEALAPASRPAAA